MSNDWKEHTGGGNPVGRKRVDYYLRGHKRRRTAEAEAVRWRHSPGDPAADVVSYRFAVGEPARAENGETDPSGLPPNAPGAKLDEGKNRLGLVLGGFSRALAAVGQVGTYGAGKYSDNGWVTVQDGEARYTDALYRHLMSEASGEERDEDTDLRHAAHAAWNALARLDLKIREAEADK